MILGRTPVGTLSLGELEARDKQGVDDLLAIVFETADKNKIYTATFDYYDRQAGQVFTKRLASEEYVTLPSDPVSNAYFSGLLVQPLQIRQSVADNDRAAGRGAPCNGTITIMNVDGELDTFTRDASVGGRAIEIKAVDVGRPFADATTVFKGVITAMEFDTESIEFRISCRSALLDTPINDDHRFLGTGDGEGGSDLEGKVKPAGLGPCFGVQPPYLGLVGGKHSYLLSGGAALPIEGSVEVFDKGVALVEVGSAPTSGQFSVDTTTGILTLGAAAEFLTVNFTGYVPRGKNAANAIETLLVDFGGLTAEEVDQQSFATFGSDQNADVGKWFGTDESTVNDGITLFLRGTTGFGALDRTGVYVVGQLKAPSGGIRAVFDESNIISIRRDPGPKALNPPAFRHNVGYQLNETPTKDVATGASETQRAFMFEQYREETDKNDNLKVVHLNSKPFFTPALFALSAAAQAEATRLVALFDGALNIYSVRTSSLILELSIGQQVRINVPRLDLIDATATILGVVLDVKSAITDLVVFA